ncbi:MAG TPA: response regulator [Methylomirabilota bacterium]|jgi:CheY-like chemotaxis protein|nr:response regulator [Methylomirabilota bacterium]
MRRVHDGHALTGLRVLLVEDVDDIRELLAFLLRIEGAEVRAAASAQDALETAATWTFDVLLTDLGLPDVAGDRLIGEILGMKGSRLRVVVMTGFGEPYAARARQAGADVVFTKPLDWSVLRAQLVEPNEALAA